MIALRRASPADSPAIAALHHLATLAAMPFLPDLHSPQDRVRFFAEVVLAQQQVWAAELDGLLAGFVALNPGWVEHLAVHPDHQGCGVGRALMSQAMLAGEPLQLWTFQRNARARAFYEGLGFTPVRLTDGAHNEEREPDVLYAWPGKISPPPHPGR